MFNGIIEELGKVTSVRDIGGGKELTIACKLASSMEVDNSLCVNGACQTVVRQDNNTVVVQAIEETLRKTALGDLRQGTEVNLERSLTLDRRIDGHIVQGHVDTTGKMLEVQKEGTNWLCTIGYDSQWRDLVVGRGSIAIDGISLTVARETGNTFTVAIIPYTWEHTAIKNRKKGDRVNLEFDIFGKYVLRFMQNREADEPGGTERGISGRGSGSSKKSGNAGEHHSGNQPDNRAISGPDEKEVTEQMLRDSGFTG